MNPPKKTFVPYDKEKGIWWCNSHEREATHINHLGDRCCPPGLGGILLPCMAVFAEVKIEESDDKDP